MEAKPKAAFLDEREAAAFLGVSPITLYKWRKKTPSNRKPIPYSRIGTRIFYDPEQLRTWVHAHQVVETPASDLPDAAPASKVSKS